MKQFAIVVPGSVITEITAAAYVARLAEYFISDTSVEMAKVITEIEERIVNAGFLTWEQIEEIETEALINKSED